MVDTCSSEAPFTGLESWIEAARRGDSEALGRALLSFRQYLLLLANESLNPALVAKVGASDLVQDTFCRAHRGFGEFRGRSEAEWRDWLRTILVRSLAYHRRRFLSTAKRRQGREVPIESEFSGAPRSREPSPIQQLADREREAAVLAAVEGLPSRYRDVVLWRHREKLPFDEIGRRLGISAEAARKLSGRALRSLSQILSPEYGSP